MQHSCRAVPPSSTGGQAQAEVCVRCCSILQAFEGILEVLGTAGDSNLGGDDVDGLLAAWLLEQTGSEDRQV